MFISSTWPQASTLVLMLCRQDPDLAESVTNDYRADENPFDADCPHKSLE